MKKINLVLAGDIAGSNTSLFFGKYSITGVGQEAFVVISAQNAGAMLCSDSSNFSDPATSFTIEAFDRLYGSVPEDFTEYTRLQHTNTRSAFEKLLPLEYVERDSVPAGPNNYLVLTSNQFLVAVGSNANDKDSGYTTVICKGKAVNNSKRVTVYKLNMTIQQFFDATQNF